MIIRHLFAERTIYARVMICQGPKKVNTTASHPNFCPEYGAEATPPIYFVLPGCLRERWERELSKKVTVTKTYWRQNLSFASALDHAKVAPKMFHECWDRKVAALDSEKSKDKLIELLKTARFHLPCPGKQSPETLNRKVWFVRQIVGSSEEESAMEPYGNINKVSSNPH